MKRTALLILGVLCTFVFSFAQTSTESFETESHGSTNFTDNGVIFKIISQTGTFDIQGNYPNTGWSGTANDNKYIDNSNGGASGQLCSFSIKTTSNLFKVSRFWMYLGAINTDLNVTGTLTVTGKLSGVTKFTQTKTTGFATSLGTTNGFTLIDLTNLNGQNYSNIVIDQLQLSTGGNYEYAALDAFTWVKDANIVLPSGFSTVDAVLKDNALHVSWQTETETGNDHFTIEASTDGKTFTPIATIPSKAVNGNSNTAINYEWTSNGAFALAAVPLLAFVFGSLISFRRKKMRWLPLVLAAGVSVAAISCNKSQDEIAASKNHYIRMAQVDKDGTFTYSKVIKVIKD
ncbi:hypothetical protein [Niabella hirudinis]|uniref:hypothetical protein n=1 Tax=Niabella hirudinis TaxID=1285929 RepID=UPI003EB86F12